MIIIRNHGPLITASDYWGSPHEEAGKLVVSCNAGAIRCLLPRSLRPVIPELRRARYAIVSRGPWPEMGLADAVEILWEDDAEDPHAWHLGAASFVSGLPARPEPDREWTIAVWDLKKGRPHKALERRCLWRQVPWLPWMRRWEGG